MACLAADRFEFLGSSTRETERAAKTLVKGLGRYDAEDHGLRRVHAPQTQTNEFVWYGWLVDEIVSV